MPEYKLGDDRRNPETDDHERLLEDGWHVIKTKAQIQKELQEYLDKSDQEEDA